MARRLAAFLCAGAFGLAAAVAWMALVKAVPALVWVITRNRYFAEYARVTTMLAAGAAGMALFLRLWARLEGESDGPKRRKRTLRWCLAALVLAALAAGCALFL